MTYESIDDVALEAVLKTRFQGEEELLARYIRICNKAKIIPLWGQLREALHRLKSAGKIKYVKGSGVKRS